MWNGSRDGKDQPELGEDMQGDRLTASRGGYMVGKILEGRPDCSYHQLDGGTSSDEMSASDLGEARCL